MCTSCNTGAGNAGEYCRGSSAEEQVMIHGDHKNKWNQEPEVTDEMTSQQSVKYGEEKIEKVWPVVLAPKHYWTHGRFLV